MTLQSAITEAPNRCGEGYENWQDRATQSFLSALVTMVSSEVYPPSDFFGLFYTGEKTLATATESFSLCSFIDPTLAVEILYPMSLTAVDTNGTYNIILASASEKLAVTMNPELLGSSRVWVITPGPGMTIVLDETLTSELKVTYNICALDRDLFSEVTTELSSYFTPAFVEDLIRKTVISLVGETKE